METATLANGCFWCTEAIFKRLKGVESVTSGYANSNIPNPTYEQVCSKTTGAAEALQIEYDKTLVDFETLLDVFFATHDPTTLNQDGANFGTDYRSAIFYKNDEEKKVAEEKIKQLKQEKKYDDPIVTAITPFTNFYKAEDYHQDFYESGNRPDYCRYIIDPKIQKLLTGFNDKVKEEYK
ncbi:MAG TPA: peptide-methionine (S)-S-oxide reductase MsrA [Candidatus Limnocylindrales bacterium]|nr:peptide-methionine (S)-S-oxide reductase MsrA [Candidatus Limnocylindrales bacterium]